MTLTVPNPQPLGHCAPIRALLFSAVAATFVLAPPAAGQQASDLSNIDRRIEQQERPKPPVGEAPVAVPEPLLPAAPTEPIEPFILSGVMIEGATAFEMPAFVPLYEPFLTRKVTGDDVKKILARFTKKYVEAGYFLSQAVAPEQEIQNGILRVRIIEGYVSKLTVDGDYGGQSVLDRYATPVLTERPLRLATLERALLLMNDLSGLSVDPSVKPVDENAGEYEIVVKTQYRKFGAFGRLDNRGTPEVGRLQGYVGGSANSLLGFGETVQANFVTVPNQPEELLFGSLSGTVPVGGAGTAVSLFGALSAVDPGSSKDALDSDSNSRQVIARIWHPVLRSRAQSLWVTGTFDFRDFDEKQFDQTVTEDRTRALRLGATYTAADRLKGQNQINLEVSQGLDILDSSQRGSNTLSRADGRPDFTKLSGGLIRLQDLTKRFAVRLAFAGQWSANPLLSYEEFVVGGEQFGRGYDFAEISGDDGVAGSAEIRFTDDTPWTWFDEYQVYGFYDFGTVWNDDARDSLSSAGAGLRLQLLEFLRADIQAAKPLTRPVSTRDNKDWRFFFSTALQY